ncbi:MAG TPA: glycoside hydrolase family 99-like domain-containing protein [Chthonomonadales bacterium]|nr:glycoside hydrolase family 99-like domain-containing protein [Chthonomonadales bacterium]
MPDRREFLKQGAGALGAAALAARADARPTAQAPVPPRPARADMLVGAWYFPGWNAADQWYCIAAHPAVQRPLLGYYDQDNPLAADWHVVWALEHGVSFFAYCYYTEGGTQWLEGALDLGLLRSRFIDRFRFCLLWCNHAPAERMTAREFREFSDLAVRKYLAHPSYLRVNGKPLVMILAGYHFVQTLGVEGARQAFAGLDERCKRLGLGGVTLMFAEGGIMSEQAVRDSLAAGAHALVLYNFPYAGTKVTGPGPGSGAEASYEHLVEQGIGLWKHWRSLSGGRFWPTVMTGWDRRPWTKDQDLIRTDSTPELFERSLRAAREHVDGDRAVMIAAWNEWAEGSALEPSVEHRFAYLDRVRSVFCPGAGPHTDRRPTESQRRALSFRVELPHIEAWRFHRTADGWTRTGADELRFDAGALRTVSRSGDPQLTSPASYVPCARYRAVRLRMRAACPPGGPEAATGQLFWSTVDHELSEGASVTFRVPLDGEWHEHTLDVGSHPRWHGMLHRFRLDPADRADVAIDLDEVVLVRR